MSSKAPQGALSLSPPLKAEEGALSIAPSGGLEHFASVLAAVVEQALAKRTKADVGPRTGISLSNPPALLTVAQALDVMGVNDAKGRAFLEAHDLIGWYAGKKRVALARLLAAGYPADEPANDDAPAAPEPDGVQYAEDMLR